jgi:hypothetical protein
MRFPGSASSLRTSRIAEIGADTGQVPDRWAPGVVGDLRPRCQGVRRQPQGQRNGQATATRPGSRARRGRASLPARPIPSLVNATDRSPVDAASGAPSSRLAGPFWSSSAPAVRPDRTVPRPRRRPATTPASVPNAPSATTSASWRPRLQGHPPTRRLSRRAPNCLDPAAPRRCCRLPAHRGFGVDWLLRGCRRVGVYRSSPSWRARMTAWVRLATPSLSKMWVTWLLTVARVTTSSSAIAWLELPAASN